MELDIRTIHSIFDKYNTLIFEKCFDCKLPTPQFAISKSNNWLGQFSFMRVDITGYSYKIRISKNFDYNIDTLTNVIVHEMLHEYIQFNEMYDNNSHGVKFHYYMNVINNKFNNITITVRNTNEVQQICKPTPVILFTISTGQRCYAKISNSAYTHMFKFINQYFAKYGSVEEAICEPCYNVMRLRKSTSTLHYKPITDEIFKNICKDAA